MNAKNYIDMLIEAKNLEETKKKQELGTYQDQVIDHMHKDAIRVLGSTLQWLLDKGQITVKAGVERAIWTWVLDSKFTDELQVSPIGIEAKRRYKSLTSFEEKIVFYYTYQTIGGSTKQVMDSVEWLVLARENYEGYKRMMEADAARELQKEYRYALNFNVNEDEVRARELHRKLCEVAPSFKDDYDKDLRIWMSRRDDRLKEEQEKAEYQATLQVFKDSYRDAYQAYHATCMEIYNHNQAIVEKVATEFNTLFTIFELTYGIVAFDENEKYVETQTEWVKGPGTKDHIFTLLDGTIMRYYHPVSLKRIFTGPDASFKFCRRFMFSTPSCIPQNHTPIPYITGLQSSDMIRKSLDDRGFKEYPEEPQASDELDYRDRDSIRDAVTNMGNADETE